MQVAWPSRRMCRGCGFSKAACHDFRIFKETGVTGGHAATTSFQTSFIIAVVASVAIAGRVRRAVCFRLQHRRSRGHTPRRAGSVDDTGAAVAGLLSAQAVKIDQSGGSIPTWMAILLDSFAEIRINENTENEVWILEGIPCVGSYEVVRKSTSLVEIAIGGFASGTVVEFTVALLCHPFETVSTRLQADPKQALRKYPTFKGLYDGFGPVALTVPVLAVFWATRDAVRKSILGAVNETIPGPFSNAYATTIASIVGESVYWFIKAPSKVLKTQQQVNQLEISKRMPASDDSLGVAIRKCIEAWPVLALVDVPYVALRVGIFLGLHDSGLVPVGAGEDALLYTFANVLAVMLTTPLDVIRTQLLLGGKPLQDLPAVIQEVYDESGVLGFLAGWSPRLVYNGIIVGIVWGFVRQEYADVRARFFLEVLDRIERFAG